MNVKREHWFQLFKYSVYAAVSINVFLFLQKEIASAAHRFAGEYALSDFLDAFTSTLDTGAWVILLLLFELETYVIDDEKLKGNLKWIFRFIRGGCYVIIVSSFVGYISGYNWLTKFEPATIENLCEVVGKSWMEELDDFTTLTEKNCKTVAKSDEFYLHPSKPIYTDSYYLKETRWLSIIDILNSLAWILVVVVLEIDVWLQLKNQFIGKAYRISNFIKNILYLTLLFAAIYWGIFGDFLEFWDAFLWIVAFVFIEMNLIEWKKETDVLNEYKNE